MMRRVPRPAVPVSIAASEPSLRTNVARLATVGTAGTVFAAAMIALGWRTNRYSPGVFAAAESIGLIFLAIGLVAWWWRAATRRVGQLMVAVGVSWYLGNLQASTNPLLVGLGFWLYYLALVILGHLVLAFPTGRLSSPLARRVVAGAYLAYLVVYGLRYLDELPTTPRPPFEETPLPVSVWAHLASLVGLGFMLVVLVLVIQQWRAASSPARRTSTPVWIAVLMLAAVAVAKTVASLLKAGPDVQLGLLLLFGVGMIGLPFAFLIGLLRVRLASTRVADNLRIELERSADPGWLREVLARELGDPSLALGFWVPDAANYVDAEGKPITLPPPGSGQQVTVVKQRGAQLAVLVHDPALAEQRPLVDAAVNTAALAIQNARRQAELRAQLEGVRVCKVRIVELALGIYPPLLTERGLAVAAEMLAKRAPLPVSVDVPPERWPSAVEVTAYLVIAEALVNITKHAKARHARVEARAVDHRVVMKVVDDGVGSVHPERGAGLTELHDCVVALGGTLAVKSPRGGGTCVEMELPNALSLLP